MKRSGWLTMSECEIVKMRMQFSYDTLFYYGIFKKAQQMQFMNVVKNRICREKPDRASPIRQWRENIIC